MSDVEQELRALAVKLAKEEWPIGSDEQHKLDADLFERVLRESGLLELLKAGQDYRSNHKKCSVSVPHPQEEQRTGLNDRCPFCRAWDAARAKWRKGVGLE